MRTSRLRLVATVPLLAVAMTACALVKDSGDLDLEAAWEWNAGKGVAFHMDGSMDWLTGEVWVPVAGDAREWEVVPRDSEAYVSARATHHERECKRYLEPTWWTVLEEQGNMITELLRGAVAVQMQDEYSQEFLDAHWENERWAADRLPDDSELPEDFDERIQFWDDAVEAKRDRWEELHSHLNEMRTYTTLLGGQRTTEAFSADNVIAAQEFFIDVCDLEMPDDYEHPSPAELGIVVYEPTPSA